MAVISIRITAIEYRPEPNSVFIDPIARKIASDIDRRHVVVRPISLSDLVNKVDDVVARIPKDPGDTVSISPLDLIGHGEPGLLSMGGSGQCRIRRAVLSSRREAIAEVAPLKAYLNGSVVRLLGCSTGVESPFEHDVNSGPKLLVALEDALNCMAYGTKRGLDAEHFTAHGWDEACSSLLVRYPPDSPVDTFVGGKFGLADANTSLIGRLKLFFGLIRPVPRPVIGDVVEISAPGQVLSPDRASFADFLTAYEPTQLIGRGLVEPVFASVRDAQGNEVGRLLRGGWLFVPRAKRTQYALLLTKPEYLRELAPKTLEHQTNTS